MKKYRLIKEYSGSPVLDTIIVESMITGSRPKFRTFTISGYDKNYDMGEFRIDNPEISPEHWEEIIEYPIGTKVYNSQNNIVYTKKEDGWYKPAERTTFTDEMIGSRKYLTVLDEEEVIEKDYEILSWEYNNKIFSLLNEKSKNGYVYCKEGSWLGLNSLKNNYNDSYNIHSVKRLSDGEIFTIGDFVNWEVIKFKITTISLSENYIYLNEIRLDRVSKMKLPLFTTEDGVDIFEDTTVYGINSSWLIFSHFTDLKEKIKYWGNKPIFSTEEAAEEYILMNKPCLSVKNVINAGYGICNPLPLKNIIKSKG